MDNEKVRVVATPEAYEVIMNSLDDLKVQWTIKTAVSLALGTKERDSTTGHLIGDTYLSVWPRWAVSEEEESIIIISHHWLMGDGNQFDEVLPDCVPVELA